DEGGPWRLYREPRNAFTAGFLGTTTLLPVDVLDGVGNQSRVRISGSQHEFIANGVRPAGGVGYVSLRPEDILCSSKATDGSVPGRVTKRMFNGVNTFLRVETPKVGSLVALEMPGTGISEGAEVHVSWQPQNARLLPRNAT